MTDADESRTRKCGQVYTSTRQNGSKFFLFRVRSRESLRTAKKNGMKAAHRQISAETNLVSHQKVKRVRMKLLISQADGENVLIKKKMQSPAKKDALIKTIMITSLGFGRTKKNRLGHS